MNAIEILTDLLRGGSRPAGGQSPANQSPAAAQGGPDLGSVFRDIFGGGGGAPSQPSAPQSTQPEDLEREARDLEQTLGVGRSGGAPAPSYPGGSRAPSQSSSWNAPTPGRAAPPVQQPQPERRDVDPEQQSQEEAIILIRAMVQAAKADGRLTPEEQQAILERTGGSSPDVINFLQKEFQTPMDVRDFAWSVPIGLEQKVYTISLSAIDLDTKAESDYLRQLAHGLRISDQVCGQLHQRYGVQQLG